MSCIEFSASTNSTQSLIHALLIVNAQIKKPSADYCQQRAYVTRYHLCSQLALPQRLLSEPDSLTGITRAGLLWFTLPAWKLPSTFLPSNRLPAKISLKRFSLLRGNAYSSSSSPLCLYLSYNIANQHCIVKGFHKLSRPRDPPSASATFL